MKVGSMTRFVDLVFLIAITFFCLYVSGCVAFYSEMGWIPWTIR